MAVPWQLDMRVFWYRKSLFEKAGVEVPTDWASLLEAGKALKKIGAFGFATGAGAGNNIGTHSMVMMMINNGGGVFTKDGKLDVMNDRNVEAIEFVLELVSNGIIDPASVSYTTDNLNAQWKNKKAAFGIHTAWASRSASATPPATCWWPAPSPARTATRPRWSSRTTS